MVKNLTKGKESKFIMTIFSFIKQLNSALYFNLISNHHKNGTKTDLFQSNWFR